MEFLHEYWIHIMRNFSISQLSKRNKWWYLDPTAVSFLPHPFNSPGDCWLESHLLLCLLDSNIIGKRGSVLLPVFVGFCSWPCDSTLPVCLGKTFFSPRVFLQDFFCPCVWSILYKYTYTDFLLSLFLPLNQKGSKAWTTFNHQGSTYFLQSKCLRFFLFFLIFFFFFSCHIESSCTIRSRSIDTNFIHIKVPLWRDSEIFFGELWGSLETSEPAK